MEMFAAVCFADIASEIHFADDDRFKIKTQISLTGTFALQTMTKNKSRFLFLHCLFCHCLQKVSHL